MTIITILLCITGIFFAGYITAGVLSVNDPQLYYSEGFHDGYHKALNDLKDINKEGNKYEVL